MTLDTAVALAELIDGQIKFLWTAIGVIAVAQIAILRAVLNATGTRRGAIIFAVLCALSIVSSYALGYFAASGLVTLVREAGDFGAAATDAIRSALEDDIKNTLSTVEVFIGGQAIALILAALFVSVSFLTRRDLVGRVLDGNG